MPDLGSIVAATAGALALAAAGIVWHRLDRHDCAINGVRDRIAGTEAGIAGIEPQIKALHGRFGAMETRVEARMDRLEAKIDGIVRGPRE